MSFEPQIPTASFFVNGGLAGAAIRTFDWSTTPLGSLRDWPASLKSYVRSMLHTRQPTAIFWGPELINIYNDGFLPILGDKHPVAMGQRAEDCWREAWPIVGAQLHDVLRGKSILREEVLVPITRAGRLDDAWWNYSYSPLHDDDGTVAGVLVVCTEITGEVRARRSLERAKREADLARQELQGIFMQAPVPMCILTGAEHRFALVNPLAAQLVGRDVLGRSVREAFDDDVLGYYLPLLDRVFRTGEPVVVREAPLRLPSSKDAHFIDFTFQPHRDASDAIAGVMVLVHDVTAQVLAGRQLEQHAAEQAASRAQADQLRVEAEQASHAKDEFLATVSHELRTPLTAILGWATILAESPDRDRIRKGIAIIERNARAQAKLIDDILDVSRIVSGRLRLGVSPVDVAAVVHAAVETIRPAALAKEIRLDVDLAVDAPLVADADRLQQIVWNLLSNAVKFTPHGGDVRVRATQRDHHVHLEVQDSGEGIAPDLLPRVFDGFHQGPLAPAPRKGLGLGLSIVRHLVELHGGSVTARSDGHRRGATFEVRLPVRARGFR